MRAWSLVAALAGCGRLQFDSRSDASIIDDAEMFDTPADMALDAFDPVLFVQNVHAATNTTGVTSIVASPGMPHQVGDFNVVVVGFEDITSGITSVTDSATTFYTQLTNLERAGNVSQTIYLGRVVTAGTNTITVGLSGTNRPSLRVLTYRGFAASNPFETGVSNPSINTTTCTTGVTITTNPNDLLIAAATTNNTTTMIDPDYIERDHDTFDNVILERVVWAAGPYQASTTTMTTGSCVMQLIALRRD